GKDQTVTIPPRYVDFLKGTTSLSKLPSSTILDPTQLSDLTGTLDTRFTVNTDGSATFKISGGAPRLDGTNETAGAYFLVALDGDLTIVHTLVISGDLQLKLSETGLEFGFDGKIDLGGFAKLSITGGAVIENGVFASYVQFSANFSVAGIIIKG